MVAEPGIEPGATGYEPVEMPLLYSALMIKLLLPDVPMDDYNQGLYMLVKYHLCNLLVRQAILS